MRRITGEEPIGTRVLVTCDDEIHSGRIAWFGGCINLVEVESRNAVGTVTIEVQQDQVYLDRPEPGTFAWACETALTLAPNQYMRRREYVDLSPEQKVWFVLNNYNLCWLDGSHFVVHQTDIAATDWEVADASV